MDAKISAHQRRHPPPYLYRPAAGVPPLYHAFTATFQETHSNAAVTSHAYG